MSLVPYDDDDDENAENEQLMSDNAASGRMRHSDRSGSDAVVADYRTREATGRRRQPAGEDDSLPPARYTDRDAGQRGSNRLSPRRSSSKLSPRSRRSSKLSPRSSSSKLSPRGSSSSRPKTSPRPLLAPNDHYRLVSQTSPRSASVRSGESCAVAAEFLRRSQSRSDAGAARLLPTSSSRRSSVQPECMEEEGKIKIEKEEKTDESSAAIDYSKLTPEQIIAMEKQIWIRSAPADLYYERDPTNPTVMIATERSSAFQVS